MTPIFTYEAHKPGSPTLKFETLGEAVRFCRNPANEGYRLRRCRPKGRHAILEVMLRERGLGHLVIWYRPSRPQGWMISEEHEGPGYQRVGYSFSQAVEMIRGKTLQFMFGAEKRSASR